jgi:hypothetical protein
MTKAEIIEALENNHKAFSDFMISLSKKDFLFAPEGKWSAGQQLDHIIRAVSPLAIGLRLPKFVFSLSFGVANRPSKDYEALVKKYQARLEAGGKARGRFVPAEIGFEDRQKSIDQLRRLVARLKKNMNSFSETQLDKYILPHPLLGKVTIREMMYFTMYHVQHHHQLALKNIGHSISSIN